MKGEGKMKQATGWYIEEYTNPLCFEIRDTDGAIVAGNKASDYENKADYLIMLTQAQRLISLIANAEQSSDQQLSVRATLLQFPRKLRSEAKPARS